MFTSFILLLEQNPLLLLILTTVFGLIIGSFINVVIYRLPLIMQQSWRSECKALLAEINDSDLETVSLSLPRSHCPHCKKTIPIYYNIPVIGYLVLGGKCAHCHTKISMRYPLIEILCAILSFMVIYQLGFTVASCAALLLTWGLLIQTFIDFDHQLLPDGITYSLLWLGLLVNSANLFTTTHDAILGAITGYCSLWIIAALFKRLRGIDGMGHGDFKLFAMAGAWMGWYALPIIALLASFIGCIVGGTLMVCRSQFTRHTHFAFGPYLAMATWAMVLFSDNIYAFVQQIIG